LKRNQFDTLTCLNETIIQKIKNIASLSDPDGAVFLYNPIVFFFIEAVNFFWKLLYYFVARKR